MNLLVTGATGFVGAAVASRLLTEAQHHVKVAVRRESPDLIRDATVVRVDALSQQTDWSAAVSNVDAVVHTAARVHVMREVAVDPLVEFRRVNVAGTLALARQAAAAGVQRFVFLSSVKANGECTEIGNPYTEDDKPAPIEPYGITKLEAEQGLFELGRLTGMEVVVIRPPLVYGPRVKGNFLRLLRMVDKGVPLPFSGVENQRSFVSLSNLIDFIVVSVEHPGAANEVFFVSDREDLSTGELVRRLAASMNRRARLFPVPLALTRAVLQLSNRDEVWSRLFGSLQVSSEKAERLLGWKPLFTVNEATKALARWYFGKVCAR